MGPWCWGRAVAKERHAMGPHGERDFVGVGSALSIDPVMQIFLPASNAIINLIWSVHEIKCFF